LGIIFGSYTNIQKISKKQITKKINFQTKKLKVPSGPISPNQVKSCQRTAFGKKMAVKFQQ